MSDAPHWMSSKAAAAYLGITNRTLYRLIDAGELTAYKFGRVIRLKREDVEAFIEASKVEPGTLKHLYPDAAPKGDEDDDGGRTLRTAPRRWTVASRAWATSSARSRRDTAPCGCSLS